MLGKQQLASEYGVSSPTIRKWINHLANNFKSLCEARNDTSYLAFQDYNKFQKVLTPAQTQIFKKHYGQP